MRKLLAMLLALVMVLSLAACGSSSEGGGEDTKAETTEAAKETQEDVKTESGEVLHEIYQLENRQALQGLISPKRLVNRSGLYKALPSETKDEILVGITTLNMQSGWFVDLEEGATDYFDTHEGFEYSAVCNEFDDSKALAQLDTFASLGCDQVMGYVAAQSLPNFADVCVNTYNIPYISMAVADDPYVPVVTCVAAGEFEMGWKVGCYVGENLINKQWEEGEVITATMLYGDTGTTISDSKNCGMLAGMIYGSCTARGEEWVEEDAMLAGYNYIQEIIDNGKCYIEEIDLDIVGVATGIGATTDSALQGAEDMVTLSPDQDMMFANNDFIAIAGIIALQQMDKKVGEDVFVWACSDASAPACEYVKTGELWVTGVNSAYGMSKGCAQLVDMIWHEGFDASDLPIHTMVPAAVITADNVDEWFTLGRDMSDPPDAIIQDTATALAEYGMTEAEYVGP